MRTFKAALFILALPSFAVVACGASPGAEGTGESSAAVTGGGTVGTHCSSDSSCESPLVCDLICPIIPDRAHCDIAGGECAVACTAKRSSLSGSKFESTDGAHSITFTSDTAFSKSDGCPTTGIHCDHVTVETGKYTVSNGTTITLTPTTGTKDTLTVEPHCYDGLLDKGDDVELYPSN